MLRRLVVENYLLIGHLEMELDPHLNIITGETGAGKSILLGALGLLLGQKSEGAVWKDPARNCVVEGTFDLTGLGLEPLFEELDLDYADQSVVRRLITPAGKSRAFVNDSPVQLALLRDLGARLVDIHSQHRNLILSSEEFRAAALDAAAGAGPLFRRYAAGFAALGTRRRDLAALRDEAERSRHDEEWLRHQTGELTAAALREGEQAELEEELALLEHADRIGEALAGLRGALDEEERGILPRLKSSETAFRHLQEHYPAGAEYADRLRAVIEELKDLGDAAAEAADRLDADPERMGRTTERLNTLYTLEQKYRVADLGELIALRDRSAARLAAITRDDERLAEAEAQLAEAEREAAALAAELHESRLRAIPEFEERIGRMLGSLGMAGARFRIALTPRETLGRTGGDGVEFLFTANPRTEPQPVERIASGGELSRVMLALKALLAERMQLPTLLFDDIDPGVSGRIADAMGEIIATLGNSMQVVDITHLPQVASKGGTHFVVYKDDDGTRIARLTPEERITEIAKMLSGSKITPAALEQARILLGR